MALFISTYTVKNHRHRICRKLSLKDENNALVKRVLQHKDLLKRNYIKSSCRPKQYT
ncbi:LuxR C-terminal-related transcriptional regulator [Niabella aquatica]